MQTSKILARIVGPTMIVPAIGIFLNFGVYQRLIEDFGKSPGLCYLGGLMGFLMGLLVLQFHNRWEAGWPVIITILGWITLIKGLVLMLFPGSMINLWHPLTASPTALIVSFVISLAIGIFLTVKGYWG
jgi:F0F1-type ATP synthase membrane subunit a